MRWLLGAGRLQEAATIIRWFALELLAQPSRSAAKVNGHEAPEHLLKAADLTEKEDLEVEVVGTRGGGTILDLFRPTKMALRTINMCFQWFSATM